MSKLKCLLALALAFLLLPLAVPARSDTVLPSGYREVARNTAWTLFLKEANLGLIMQNNKTGELMLSTVENPQDYRDNDLWKGFYQSGIVLEYIDGTINKYPWANLVTTEHQKAFVYHQNGFDCRVSYPALGIAYTVQVRLEGSDLSIHLPQTLFTEKNPQYTISSFYIYPFMGYTHMGESGGYMLIPDGQGALIDLKDNEGRFSSPYKGQVYGTNIGLTELAQGAVMNNFATGNPPERAIMPVFGMRHENSGLGYVAILESGDSSATIQATMNGVGNMGFDWVCAMYTYRVVYAQSTGPSSGTVNMRTPRAKQFDITQRFRFLQGDQATYAGMAVAYRNYLEERGAFRHVQAGSPFGIQVDFLGAERKNGLFGTQAVIMTTAQQAQDIWQALDRQGVSNVLSVYKGWQALGYSGALPTRDYAPAGFLGGQHGFRKWYDLADKLGYRAFLEADVASMNPETAGSLVYSALKRVDSNTFSYRLYGMVYDSRQLLSPLKSLEVARHLADSLSRHEVPGVSLTGITQLVSDFTYRGTYYDSLDTTELYNQAASAFESLPTLLQGANAYLWPQAEALTNMPVAGSDYAYTSHEVPFLAIALSGKMPVYAEYTNFQANTRQFFLRLVEQGARPAFLITHEDPIALQETNANDIFSSRYDLYEQIMVEWFLALETLHKQLSGASIICHSQWDQTIAVGWSNGLSVLINQSDTAKTILGILVPAHDFKVVNTP